MEGGLCKSCAPLIRVDSASCTPCSGGNYSTDGISCINCDAGKFSVEGICQDCENGTTSEPGAASCDDCPTGKYGVNSFCVECAMGKYQDITGETECKLCEMGTYTPDATGFENCQLCSSGMYLDEEGKHGSPCKKCSEGKYSSDTRTFCKLCSPGTYGDQMGQGACKNCGPGKYSNDYGWQWCTQCPPGWVSTNITCIRCPQDKIASRDNSKCISCPKNTQQNYDENDNSCETEIPVGHKKNEGYGENIKCEDNTYRLYTVECQECDGTVNSGKTHCNKYDALNTFDRKHFYGTGQKIRSVSFECLNTAKSYISKDGLTEYSNGCMGFVLLSVSLYDGNAVIPNGLNKSHVSVEKVDGVHRVYLTNDAVSGSFGLGEGEIDWDESEDGKIPMVALLGMERRAGVDYRLADKIDCVKLSNNGEYTEACFDLLMEERHGLGSTDVSTYESGDGTGATDEGTGGSY